LKVAQDGEEAIDVTEMRLDDAIKLIRGKKGTKVILTVKKPDGSILDISIVRDVVIIEVVFDTADLVQNTKQVPRESRFHLIFSVLP
jgi:carboxyl-terminal processing protease